jgi:hypothetical protein
MVQGRQTTNNYKYCILAHAFRTRGYEPVIPVCYKHLPLCREKSPEFDDQVVCDSCNFQANGILDTFGLSSVGLSDVFGDGYEPPQLQADIAEDVTYRGVRVSDYARASTRKFLKKYHINGEKERGYYQRFLNSAGLLVDLANRLFDSRDINAVIAHDVNYVYGGVFLAVAENRGIPAYSNVYSYSEGKIMFGRQSNAMATAVFTDREFVEEYLQKPLTAAQEDSLNSLMRDRMSGERRNFDYSPNTGRSVDLGTETTAGMFTNLIWDDSLAFDSERLPSYFEWVDTTIQYFTENRDVGLVIKTHPAEAVHGTNERVGDYIRGEFGDLPDNIKLLDPETDRDTYAIARDIDVGLVYNSTVGLEMAYTGGPVVVAGLTHYRDHGFTFDAESKEDYLEKLSSLETLSMTESMKTRAKRYAHLLFISKQIDFPYVTFISSGESGYGYELHPVSHAELKPGNEPFDRIVSAVISDEPVINEYRDHQSQQV